MPFSVYHMYVMSVCLNMCDVNFDLLVDVYQALPFQFYMYFVGIYFEIIQMSCLSSYLHSLILSIHDSLPATRIPLVFVSWLFRVSIIPSIFINWNSARKSCLFSPFYLTKYLCRYGLIGIHFVLLVITEFYRFVAMALRIGHWAFLRVGSCVLLICPHDFRALLYIPVPQ